MILCYAGFQRFRGEIRAISADLGQTFAQTFSGRPDRFPVFRATGRHRRPDRGGSGIETGARFEKKKRLRKGKVK
jgi:hypothetical protein